MGTQEPRRYVRHNESQRERIITAAAQLVKEWGLTICRCPKSRSAPASVTYNFLRTLTAE